MTLAACQKRALGAVETVLASVRVFQHSRAQHTASASSSASGSSKKFRPPTPPAGIPLSKIFNNLFPLSYSESFQQWRDRDEKGDTAQDAVLSMMPFYPNRETQSVVARTLPGGEQQDLYREGRVIRTPVSGSELINEFEISQYKADGTSIADQDTHHIMVLHGYGAGLGFFFRNFNALSKIPNSQIHALDLLGYGLSSRPSFHIRSNPRTLLFKKWEEQVTIAENFFLDSIEEWRQKKGIKKFSVVAHSLGAYLISEYAVKYPGHIDKIVLASPAAVSHTGMQFQQQTDSNSDKGKLSNKKASLKDISQSSIDTNPTFTTAESKIPKIPLWFKIGWELNFSPFALVRQTGPLGPRFVSGWTSRRFPIDNHTTEEESKAMHKYTYEIFRRKGSGEFCLNYLLAPGAVPRRPLVERVHKLGELGISTTWVYGSNDWVDVNGGHESARRIKRAGGHAEVHVVPGAGHQLYMDQPSRFNEIVVNFLRRNTSSH